MYTSEGVISSMFGIVTCMCLIHVHQDENEKWNFRQQGMQHIVSVEEMLIIISFATNPAPLNGNKFCKTQQ